MKPLIERLSDCVPCGWEATMQKGYTRKKDIFLLPGQNWKGTVSYYLGAKIPEKESTTGEGIAAFFSRLLHRKLPPIRYLGQILVLIDEVLFFRQGGQLEFDFISEEKVSV